MYLLCNKYRNNTLTINHLKSDFGTKQCPAIVDNNHKMCLFNKRVCDQTRGTINTGGTQNTCPKHFVWCLRARSLTLALSCVVRAETFSWEQSSSRRSLRIWGREKSETSEGTETISIRACMRRQTHKIQLHTHTHASRHVKGKKKKKSNKTNEGGSDMWRGKRWNAEDA